MADITPNTIVLAITGASGSIYGIRLLQALMAQPVRVYLMVSPSGRKVMIHETGYGNTPLLSAIKENGARVHDKAELMEIMVEDMGVPVASGSFRHQGMVVAPCSMNTLAAIAAGITENSIHRAADVSLKERRPLILMPRETPFNLIHLRNMVRAAEAGAVIMPPCPGFYQKPATIEDLVDAVTARVLDHLGFVHELTPRWGG